MRFSIITLVTFTALVLSLALLIFWAIDTASGSGLWHV